MSFIEVASSSLVFYPGQAAKMRVATEPLKTDRLIEDNVADSVVEHNIVDDSILDYNIVENKFPIGGYKGRLQQQRIIERPLHCPVCSKIFKTAGKLKSHIALHTQKQPYACDSCPEVFRTFSALHNHYQIHSREKSCGSETHETVNSSANVLNQFSAIDCLFTCKQCKKSFTSADTLQVSGIC